MLSSLACSQASSVIPLIIFRITQAIGAGAMIAGSTAIVKDSFDSTERLKIIALIQMLVVLAPAIAPIVGVYIIRYASWRLTFDVLAGLSLITLILSFLYVETLPKEERFKGSILSTFSSLSLVTKNSPFMLFLVSISGTGLIYMAFIAISSYIYINWFHLTETQYSLFFASNSVVLFIGPNVYLKLRKILQPRTIVLWSFGLIMLGGLLTILYRTLFPLFIFYNLPSTFSSSFLRAFATNILLNQENMNAGVTASVINFINTALGACGMVVLGTLPWSSYILGLGTIAISMMIISLTLIFIFYKKGCQLTGFNK